MLIAALTWAGTLLLTGEEVMLEGEGGDSFCQNSHEQFVEAGHESDRAKVACVRGVFLLMY